LHAVTASGVTFESMAQRTSDGSSSAALVPGDPLFVTFDAPSVRAYRDENIA
jgi:hypothetical protein